MLLKQFDPRHLFFYLMTLLVVSLGDNCLPSHYSPLLIHSGADLPSRLNFNCWDASDHANLEAIEVGTDLHRQARRQLLPSFVA